MRPWCAHTESVYLLLSMCLPPSIYTLNQDSQSGPHIRPRGKHLTLSTPGMGACGWHWRPPPPRLQDGSFITPGCSLSQTWGTDWSTPSSSQSCRHPGLPTGPQTPQMSRKIRVLPNSWYLCAQLRGSQGLLVGTHSPNPPWSNQVLLNWTRTLTQQHIQKCLTSFTVGLELPNVLQV